MGSREGAVEIDFLERSLLPVSVSHEDCERGEDGDVLYRASFEEMEENFLKYQTAQWVLYSLPLVLAWGIGLLMLLYLPIRRHILRKDFRSRKLYVTPDAIVYKVTRPVPFPCCGVLSKEKHVLLPSVADVVVEQGYLQSLFGICSVRIENAGVRRPASDDVQIQGIANPRAFRKATNFPVGLSGHLNFVAYGQQLPMGSILESGHIPSVGPINEGWVPYMQPAVVLNRNSRKSLSHLEKYYEFYSAIVQAVLTRLSNLRSEDFSQQVSTNEDLPAYGLGYSPATWARQNIGASFTAQPMTPTKYIRHDSYNPPGELLLQKLCEVGSSLKRVESLIEERQCQTSEAVV